MSELTFDIPSPGRQDCEHLASELCGPGSKNFSLPHLRLPPGSRPANYFRSHPLLRLRGPSKASLRQGRKTDADREGCREDSGARVEVGDRRDS